VIALAAALTLSHLNGFDIIDRFGRVSLVQPNRSELTQFQFFVGDWRDGHQRIARLPFDLWCDVLHKPDDLDRDLGGKNGLRVRSDGIYVANLRQQERRSQFFAPWLINVRQVNAVQLLRLVGLVGWNHGSNAPTNLGPHISKNGVEIWNLASFANVVADVEANDLSWTSSDVLPSKPRVPHIQRLVVTDNAVKGQDRPRRGQHLASGNFVALASSLKGSPNQSNAEDAKHHSDDGGQPHRPSPRGRDALGFKVIFLAFCFASGVILLVNAFAGFRSGKPDAASLSMTVGSFAICLGVLFSVLFVSGL